MTVATTSITNGPYTGNGASDTYSYTFRVTTKNELSIYETTDAGVQSLLVVDTHYTVNNIGTDAGGTVVRVAGNLPTDYEWYIRSNYDEDQDTSFTSQGSFLPAVHEAQMDHLTLLVQQLRDSSDRSVRLDDSIENDGDFRISDDAATRADSYVVFDSNGDISTEDGQTLRTDLASTANSEGASLVGIEDSAGNFTATTTEAALAEIITNLASAATGKGASLIGVEDSAGYFTGADVEAVLAEIISLLASTTATEGAGMIGFSDPGGEFTATEVESALTEIFTILGSTLSGKGAGVIGINDSAGHFSAANVEGALAEVLAGAQTFTGQKTFNEDIVMQAANGIDFSANTHASGMTSETLDWYEEGNWTPELWDLTAATDPTPPTYTGQSGKYTRIGRQVFVTGQISVSALGSLTTGDPALIGGLPFAGGGGFQVGSVAVASGISIAANQSVTIYVDTIFSHLIMQKWSLSTGTQTMTVAEFSATGNISFSINYWV